MFLFCQWQLPRVCRHHNGMMQPSGVVAAASCRTAAYQVVHPHASSQEQQSWELALQRPTEPEASAAPSDSQAALHAPLSHPAVGATGAECCAWEEALGSSTRAPTDHPGPSRLYAVVECGSHSTRLLLSTGSTDIVRLNQDTHLGAALTATQGAVLPLDRLPAAATATLQAVRTYKACIEQYQSSVKGVVAVATASVREAPAGRVIAAAVGDILQCPVNVLSGHQEAQLAFKGATKSLCSGSIGSSRCLVVDLGGRSTELALGAPLPFSFCSDGAAAAAVKGIRIMGHTGCAGCGPELTVSIPLGCLTVRRAADAWQPADSSTAVCGGSNVTTAETAATAAADVHSPGETAAARQLLEAAASILHRHRAALGDVFEAVQQQKQEQPGQVLTVVATGGTVTTVAALLLGLESYSHEAVHMSVVTKQQLQELLLLHCTSAEQRPTASLPCWLTAERASTLAPGCAGLLVVMGLLGIEQLLVSDCDLLDGVLSCLQGGSPNGLLWDSP